MKVFGNKQGFVKAWVDGVDLDQATIDQAVGIAELPFIYKYVCLMPDAHLGLGSTVGSVIPTIDTLIPAAVGVDIGCGMISQRYDIEASKLGSVELASMRARIEAAVPTGRSNHGQAGDIGAWGSDAHPEIPEYIKGTWESHLRDGYARVCGSSPLDLRHDRALEHLGTLGTGNHFIELEYDEEDRVWLTIHSGSRGPGAKIGSRFVRAAKALMEAYYIQLASPDLAYFPKGSPEYQDYWQALRWAQDYAKYNRMCMLYLAEKALGFPVEKCLKRVHCHHNYANIERHFGQNIIVTRKGAISARDGEMGIIPGSMGAKTMIVEGKGNRESFHSASHGAGRKMSRTAARKTFTLEDHARMTDGVECDKSEGVLDETPGAYKDIEAVMAAQEDLVEVRHYLRPLLVVKGLSE